MPDPERMRQLQTALTIIQNAETEELQVLFAKEIEQFDKITEKLQQEENRFDPHHIIAEMGLRRLCLFVRRITHYNPGQIVDYITDQFGHMGRGKKYNLDTRKENCEMIDMLTARGSSKTQAMKLLMRMRGNVAETEGHMKEMRETYKDYLKFDFEPPFEEPDFLVNAVTIARSLELDITHLEGKERASKKAVEALRQLWRDIITTMKEWQPVLAEHDNGYPRLYKQIIEPLEKDHEDPLDYFYRKETLSPEEVYERRTGMREFLQTTQFFAEKGLKF